MVEEAVASLEQAAKDDEQQLLSRDDDQGPGRYRVSDRDFHTLDQLGVALHLGGRVAEADAVFAEALRASPALASGHAKLGSTLIRQGRKAEASTCYGMAIAGAAAAGLEPDARFLYNKGVLHLQLGEPLQAGLMLEAAIRADPTHVKAMGNLASVRGNDGRYADVSAQAIPPHERNLGLISDMIFC